VKKSFHMISLLALLLTFAVSTAWAAQRTLTADGNGGYYINMPKTGVDVLEVPNGVKTFNIYSDGGKDGSYSRGVDGRLLVSVATGKTLKMTGRVSGRPLSKYSQGYLSVYDGVDENAEALILDKNDVSSLKKFSSGENMFFCFWSSDLPSDNYPGPELEVTILDPNDLYSVSVESADHGSVVASVDQTTAGTVVTLDATPENGYVLNYVRYYGDYDNIDISGGQWYSNNKASFVMPAADVLVMPEFKSLEENFVLYVEKTGTSTYFIPPGMGLFGIRSERNGEADVYLVLNAPEGKVFQLMGSGNDNDSIYVYDGADANATLLKKARIKDMGRIAGSSRYMTLHYKENNETGTRSGFNVAVLDPNEPHSIIVNNSDKGSVTASAGSAPLNTTISLSVSPNEGYMLDYVDVLDSNGLPVDVTGKTWYEGGAISFKMPGTKVEINPVFVSVEDGPSINMPREGVVELAIPNAITKFHVYDDLGEKVGFSTNCNGSLLLTASDGKKIQVEGSLYAPSYVYYGRGTLTIYDGSNTAATKLVDMYYGTVPRKLSSSENMYINFKTNEYQMSGYKGLDLTVTVDDPNGPHTIAFNDVYDGSINSTLSQATAGTPIIITANPDDGYILDGVRVVDALGNELDVEGGKWYSGNTASFTMPQTDVTVSATFSNLSSTFDLDVTQSGTDSYVIPSGVNRIQLQIKGAQNEMAENYVTLSVPEGYALLMRGDVYGRECEDSLYIYDGSSVEGKELLRSAGCSEFNNVISSGANAVLHYKEMDSRYYPYTAVNMFVNVVNLNTVYNISINPDMDHGSVSSNSESAKGNTHVTLTALPESGYVLQGIEVWSNETGSVPVKGGYLSNEASFNMPFGDVSINAYFEPITYDYLRVVMPDTGTLVVDIPEGITSFTVSAHFNNSRHDKDAMLVLNAPEGRKIQLGPLMGQMRDDFIRAYDGPDSSSTLLFNRSSDGNGKISIDAYYGGYVTSGRSASIVQPKDNENEFGFELKVIVVDPEESHNISIANEDEGAVGSNVSSAKANAQIALSVEPTGNNVINRIEVTSGLATIPVTGGTWYTSNSASFTMPGTDVTVQPYYASGWTVDAGLTIEKPRFEKLEVSIPEEVESFRINGGVNISSSSQAPGKPLILTAPVGKLLQLKTIYGDPYNDDYFVAFNGAYDDPIAKNASPIEGNVSSGRILTLIDYLGWNENSIVVELIPNQENDVRLSDVPDNGSVTSNHASAYAGDTITLTAAPDDGYVLYEMEAWWYDEYNNQHYVEVTGGTWYNNEAKFVMPLADVYYTAYFAPRVYMDYDIYIPKTGNISVNIPEGVTQLTVYDDNSGYYGAYSDNNDGTLTLTAPEGYSLYVNGSVQTPEEADSLVIYDGADVSTPKLLKIFGNESVYNIYSSGQSLTFRFKSNADWNSYGLQLQVLILKNDSFGAVAVYELNGWTLARVDGNYTGNETVNISEPIDVNGIEYNRNFTSGVPSTIVLPFTLPEGTTINADFYELTAVVQTGNRWKATLTYIGDDNLPQPNTPYAIIPDDDYLYINFDGTATLQTSTKDTTKVSDGGWLFVGTYSNKTWAAGDSELGLAYAIAATDNEGGAKKGQFGRISAGASATPFQAYLRKKDATVQLARQQNSPAAPGTRYSVDFVPEESIDVEFVKASTDGSGDVMTVAKGRWNMRTGEFKMQRTYDIKGRKLNGTPKTHGAYYGKKALKK